VLGAWTSTAVLFPTLASLWSVLFYTNLDLDSGLDLDLELIETFFTGSFCGYMLLLPLRGNGNVD
jgi:hypothetical protein